MPPEGSWANPFPRKKGFQVDFGCRASKLLIFEGLGCKRCVMRICICMQSYMYMPPKEASNI